MIAGRTNELLLAADLAECATRSNSFATLLRNGADSAGTHPSPKRTAQNATATDPPTCPAAMSITSLAAWLNSRGHFGWLPIGIPMIPDPRYATGASKPSFG